MRRPSSLTSTFIKLTLYSDDLPIPGGMTVHIFSQDDGCRAFLTLPFPGPGFVSKAKPPGEGCLAEGEMRKRPAGAITAFPPPSAQRTAPITFSFSGAGGKNWKENRRGDSYCLKNAATGSAFHALLMLM